MTKRLSALLPMTSDDDRQRDVADKDVAAAVTLRVPSPTTYLVFLAPMILLIAALGAMSVVVGNAHDTEAAMLVHEIFWVGQEANVPTFMNFGLLSLASAFVGCVASRTFAVTDRWRWHWLAFAGLLLLFAFDEAAQVHEPVGAYLTRGIDGRSFFLWTWVIAGMGIVLLIITLGFRFLRALPRATGRFVAAAFVVYFGGALGLEMLSAFLYDAGKEHVRVVTLLEETFEMAGAAIFGAAALQQLRL